MYSVVLVSPDQGAWSEFRQALAEQGLSVSQAATGAEALDEIRRREIHLAVIDEQVGDMTGSELVRRIIMTNSLVQTALVSSLSDQEFHEALEGLGVLARLAPNPTAHDAADLVAALKAVTPG